MVELILHPVFQIFTEGLSLRIIYCQLLRHSFFALVVGILTGIASDVIACILPLMFGLVITHLDYVSEEQSKAENYTLSAVSNTVECVLNIVLVRLIGCICLFV